MSRSFTIVQALDESEDFQNVPGGSPSPLNTLMYMVKWSCSAGYSMLTRSHRFSSRQSEGLTLFKNFGLRREL